MDGSIINSLNPPIPSAKCYQNRPQKAKKAMAKNRLRLFLFTALFGAYGILAFEGRYQGVPGERGALDADGVFPNAR